MLPKSHRIRKKKEFDHIYSQHKKVRSDNMQILVHYVNEEEKKEFCKYPRFGFIVTKKIGNAITRNRIKRQLREIVRLNIINFKNNFEAIIIPYPQIVQFNYQQIEKELLNLLNNL